MKPNKHLVTTYRPKLILTLGMLLFISFGTKVNGQYFSNRYTQNTRDGFLSSLQIVDDTIYAMFNVGDSVNKPIGAFAKFDRTGSLLSTQYFDIPARLGGIGTNVNTLIRSNDGGFAYGGWTQGAMQTQNALLLLKYDRSGNFQWYNEVIDTNYLSFYPSALAQDSSSNYFFTGFLTHKVSNDDDIYIAKTDSAGNLIYMKILSDPNLNDAASGICINARGHIVIGGSGVMPNVTNFLNVQGYMKTFELDTGGNVINYVINPDPNGPASANILSLKDGGYLISSEYTCGRSPDHVYGVNCIEKLDSAFNVVWRTDAGVCSINNNSHSLSKTPDGNFIATGVSYNDTVLGTRPTNGFIVKVSEAGSLIWSKEYRGLSNSTNNDMNEFTSVGFLSDSTIIVGGLSLDYADAGHPEQGWLLHLDTAGCLPDSNSCGIVNGISDISPNAIKLVIYPNPADDIININYALSNVPEQAKIIIVNPLGQQVYDGSMTNTSGIKTINTKSWPQGMYFYTVQSDRGFETAGSFVVNH